jgi:hypothetical protein
MRLSTLTAVTTVALASSAFATITAATLFGDAYILKEGAGVSAKFYSVLDVYIKTTTSKDVMASTFGNSAFVSAYTQNQGAAFVHSDGAGANTDWLPAAGKTAWDSFVTCGNRDQASAATTLSMQLDTNWAAGNGSAINNVAGSAGPGWYPAVGSSTSTNPYSRSGFYNGNTTAINVAKTASTISGNGIVAGQSLNNHWMIGRFVIEVTGLASDAGRTMSLKFCTAGRNFASETATTFTTITGATSAAGRLDYTLTFAVPAPGAGALLAAAGLIGRRRKA